MNDETHIHRVARNAQQEAAPRRCLHALRALLHRVGMAQAEAWAAADPVTFHDEVRYHICDLNGDPIRFDH
jgi:hypothetical protein